DGLAPRLVRSHSIVGVCLIEIESLRPTGVPRKMGIHTMNAGYRIAVEWGRDVIEHGVYIPRRDTSSRLKTWLGGRAFPGVHHHSRFSTTWDDESVSVEIRSDDGRADLRLLGAIGDGFGPDSAFEDLEEVSAFFRDADRGFSPGHGRTDGIRLRVEDWHVRGFEVDRLYSGYFADPSLFPSGSLVFDSAVFMRNVAHEWETVEAPIP
ncbi:MAG: hypothetical protein R3344_11775, partial [Acidobacteriota bacterium]|nr:hypothetical protein [Acidobacteriota bacterium]